MFIPEMSQPSNAISLGSAIGSSDLNGVNTSSPPAAPTRQVALCVRDPK